jgi:hypothetical protein
MGFKIKTPGGTYNVPQTRNPKSEQRGIFKAVVLQMIQENKTDDEIIAFAENPSPLTRYGVESNSALDAAFFGGINRYLSRNDRMEVLQEIE